MTGAEGSNGVPAPYPAHREADVVLRDGSTVHVRPVRAEDRDGLRVFLGELSEESIHLRYFTGGVNLDAAAWWAANSDYVDRFSLVATAGRDHRIVGNAAYSRGDGSQAEVAFAIAEDYQGRGLGTIMLAHLAESASEHGITELEAYVLPENHKMVDVFRASGFPLTIRAEPGTIHLWFPSSLSAEALAAYERRDQAAAEAALRTFLRPGSVAVIGASRSRGSIGGEVFHNLLAGGFIGPVYPVNPSAPVVQSVVAYPSVADLPDAPDLAVIVVPASAVTGAAAECAQRGVRALVVISSGFSEVGEEGAARQLELVAVCRDAGMRLIGPNCMGILNTAEDVRLNATFAPAFPPRGRVGFLSQSGALGLAVIDRARALGLGLSSFVSVGNKADVSGNDLLNYWETDPDTDMILLYLESFGNPRRFARISRRVGRVKPIVAVKSGRSAAGARATTSHTGALLAASDVTVEALFHQAGVIRTDTLAELFDVASLLANQPVPAGTRVGIVTNAGGLGIMCADACEAGGLEVPALPQSVTDQLRAFLPAEAAVANPVDMIASASGEDFARAVTILAASGAVDAIVVIFIPPLVTRAEDVARAVGEAVDALAGDVPVLAVFMSTAGAPPELEQGRVQIPTFAFPEDAARTLAHVARYAAWRARPEGDIPAFDGLRHDEAAAVIAAALAEGPRWLPPDEVATLLSCYGVNVAPWRLTGTPAEAGAAAAELGGPVALKAVAPGLVHKTEAGAVRLDLAGEESVAAEAERMRQAIEGSGTKVERFLVQAMIAGGVEMLVGVVHDPSFGPVIACGAGGTQAELLGDLAVRITPLTDADAAEMVRSLKTYPLLEGYRGAPGADVGALEELLLRVSTLVEDHPEIAEMDLNPVKALPDAAIVVDARIRVETAEPARPLSARRT